MPSPRKARNKGSTPVRNKESKTPDRKRKSNDKFRPEDIVHEIEFAKRLAQIQARIPINSVIRTTKRSYRVLREVCKGTFNYLYEVKQKGKDGDKFFLLTEPITTNKVMERFKVLKYELLILRHALTSERTDTTHFPFLKDSGRTDQFNFLVMEPLGDTLYDITRKQMKSAFTASTAIRFSIQMLRAIMDLHAFGYLHRALSPHVFYTGARSKIRTVYLGDFGFPFMFRDKESKKIRHPRDHIRMMGSLRYMSRNAQSSKEHARRDDLESWAYITMEFFDLDILPWRDDEVEPGSFPQEAKAD